MEVEKRARGRPKGSPNSKYYKWSVVYFDPRTKTLKTGKYSTIKELEEDLNIKIGNDLAYRLHSGYRMDKTGKIKERSMKEKYGHLKLEKIKEPRVKKETKKSNIMV